MADLPLPHPAFADPTAHSVNNLNTYATMDSTFISSLEPRVVWAHFDRLCAIPRASKQEAALRDNLLAWAREQGLASRVDSIGNLILSKPASPGHENAPGVVLQGHLDMVCQKNAGTTHDFQRDPIRPVQEAGWLRTPDTTLGADNGIGVALAAMRCTCCWRVWAHWTGKCTPVWWT